MGAMGYLMKEPHLSNFMRIIVRGIEQSVPDMFSFMEGEVDHHPWERWAHASWVNEHEEDIDLCAVVRDVMGMISVPALFGRAFMENYPEIIRDVYDFDSGLTYFLLGLPWWTPWPSVMKAHLARWRVQDYMKEFSKALDDTLDGKRVDSKWDDLDDVSEFIRKRQELFRSKFIL